ncbi:unnamed protein product [Mytilus edulis]|uniref:Uncharacterized protein n=1 Tax=Mytilus edulis TaxID=6550 RepID=A0A8S3S2N2_MYTED|nr:unnamed protein product [Mytilus edulis]
MYLKDAWCEISKAVNCLIKFVALISTGDQVELQKLSDLALKHISVSEKQCRVCKDEMEQNINEILIRRQQLESKIQIKDITLSKTTSLLELKKEEVVTFEGLVRNAKNVYEEKLKTYLSLVERIENDKVAYVGINAVTSLYFLFVTAITAGAAAPIAIGLQSCVTLGSSLAFNRAITNVNSAKNELTNYKYQLQKYCKEKIKLQGACGKLQNECDKCRKEKQKNNEELARLLEHLNKTATLLECLLNFRHFISILQGRTEVLQEARKDIAFQHDLKIPLEEIEKHLNSASSLNLNNIFETQKLCKNLSGQLTIHLHNVWPNMNSVAKYISYQSRQGQTETLYIEDKLRENISRTKTDHGNL